MNTTKCYPRCDPKHWTDLSERDFRGWIRTEFGVCETFIGYRPPPEQPKGKARKVDGGDEQDWNQTLLADQVGFGVKEADG